MINDEQPQPPWYKQFWPWFLITLPLTVVIAGIATIIVAQQNAVTLVSDNYYKEGLAINSVKQLEKNAEKLSLAADILVSTETGICTIQLTGNHSSPSELTLSLFHPTLGNLDQSLQLKKIAENIYQSPCNLPQTGKWYISITNPSKSWKIKQAALLPNM